METLSRELLLLEMEGFNILGDDRRSLN